MRQPHAAMCSHVLDNARGFQPSRLPQLFSVLLVWVLASTRLASGALIRQAQELPSNFLEQKGTWPTKISTATYTDTRTHPRMHAQQTGSQGKPCEPQALRRCGSCPQLSPRPEAKSLQFRFRSSASVSRSPKPRTGMNDRSRSPLWPHDPRFVSPAS